MKHSNWLFAVAMVVGVGGAVVACGNPGKEQAEQAEALQKKMCDCKDMDCATKADKEITDWLEKNKDVKVTQANLDRIKNAMTEAGKCAVKNGDAQGEKLDDTLPPAE